MDKRNLLFVAGLLSASLVSAYDSLLPKLERNQNSAFGQIDFASRIKSSGSVRLSSGMTSRAIGLDDNNTNSDHSRMVTFLNKVIMLPNTNVGRMTDLGVDQATLNFDASLNDWAETHLGLIYWSDSYIMKNIQTQWYSRYTGGFIGNGNRLPIDEAHVTLGNFDKSPFYVRLGRQYLDFGWYDKNAALPAMTQWFSQSVHDAVTIGLLDFYGINASLSTFRSVPRGNLIQKDNFNRGVDRPFDSVNNFSVSLSYGMDYKSLSVDLKGDYLFDLYGVDYFDGYLGNGIIGVVHNDFHPGDGSSRRVRPSQRTAMMAMTLLALYNDYDLKVQYVGAIQVIPKEIWSRGGDDNSAYSDDEVSGVRPRALSVELGWSFPSFGHDTRLAFAIHNTDEAYAGQMSEDRTGVAAIKNYYIPKRRLELKLERNLAKHVDLMLSYLHDRDYSKSYFASLNNREFNDNVGDNFDNIAGTSNRNDIFALAITARFA